jgi:hypothetical protein
MNERDDQVEESDVVTARATNDFLPSLCKSSQGMKYSEKRRLLTTAFTNAVLSAQIVPPI